MKRNRFRAVLAALLLGACATQDHMLAPTVALDAGESWLKTDRAVYTAAQVGEFVWLDFELVFTNHLRVPVAVPACHTPYRPTLEKLEAGEWVHAFSPIELMCITAPLVIPAGSAYTLRYPLRADGHDVSRWPGAAEGSLAGTYRFVWFVGTSEPKADTGVGTRLPLEYTVSNTFRIE